MLRFAQKMMSTYQGKDRENLSLPVLAQVSWAPDKMLLRRLLLMNTIKTTC